MIIAGGTGQGAADIFNEREIKVITGASGTADTAVESYLSGDLRSSGSICQEHEYADECGEH